MLKDQLKKLRESRNLTKKQVADSIDVTERAYITYEYGQRDISTETLNKLADFYGVTTDYLLGREPTPNPFADLNLSEDDEAEVIAKYMSLPPEIRACMLDVLVQLGEAAKKRQTKPDPDDTDYITVSTTLGELEDQMKADEDAKSKDA